MTTTKVPLSVPWINKDDKIAVLASLKSPHLTDGPKLREFETKFSKFIGCKYAVGVSSGTAALYLSLISLGIKTHDEVIIPDLTFVATANAVIQAGGVPVCVDVDQTLNISSSRIEKAVTKKTRAIIPVHFAGYPCNMSEIVRIAIKHDLKIIEDCAHAIGTRYMKKHVGNFGKTGCFSFYPIKNITTIEGGMITTNSKRTMKIATALRNHGLTKSLIQRDRNTSPWIYDILIPGYNYRLDEVRSALGLSQLHRIDKIYSKRIDAAKYYDKKLKNIQGIEIVNPNNYQNHSYHLYIIRINKKFGLSRDKIHLKLNEKGIRTTVHYRPIHQFSFFRKKRLKDKDFPNSVSAYKECLTLPLFTTITRKQLKYVSDALLELV